MDRVQKRSPVHRSHGRKTVDNQIVCTTGITVPVGLVSEGSLRAEDLLVAALRTYEAVNPAGFVMMAVTEAPVLATFTAVRVAQINHLTGATAHLTDIEMEGVIRLCGDVVEEINEALPDGYYYGGHPGDPACVGIWRNPE